MSAPSKRKKKPKPKSRDVTWVATKPVGKEMSPGVARILRSYLTLSATAQAVAEGEGLKLMSDEELAAYNYCLARSRLDLDIVADATAVEVARRMRDNPVSLHRALNS